MHFAHRDTAECRQASEHRPGGITLTSLLRGKEGTPGNFDLMLIEAEKYYAPPHRHNFDQVRILLEGRFDYGPRQFQTQGSVGYFPEGATYTQRSDEHSLTLLLQSGGASGQGYMSYRQLQEGISLLRQHGDFRDGKYHWTSREGKLQIQDSYEAIWEQQNGRSLDYPEPRYDAPVILREDRYTWVPDGNCNGVHWRHYGSFSERQLTVAKARIEAAAECVLPAASRNRLLYVHHGRLACAERRHLIAGAAVHLEPGDSIRLRADSEAQVYVLTLMDL